MVVPIVVVRGHNLFDLLSRALIDPLGGYRGGEMRAAIAPMIQVGRITLFLPCST
jgi:hypothetical protein